MLYPDGLEEFKVFWTEEVQGFKAINHLQMVLIGGRIKAQCEEAIMEYRL